MQAQRILEYESMCMQDSISFSSALFWQLGFTTDFLRKSIRLIRFDADHFLRQEKAPKLLTNGFPTT
jgi:hypothetical protein